MKLSLSPRWLLMLQCWTLAGWSSLEQLFGWLSQSLVEKPPMLFNWSGRSSRIKDNFEVACNWLWKRNNRQEHVAIDQLKWLNMVKGCPPIITLTFTFNGKTSIFFQGWWGWMWGGRIHLGGSPSQPGQQGGNLFFTIFVNLFILPLKGGSTTVRTGSRLWGKKYFQKHTASISAA